MEAIVMYIESALVEFFFRNIGQVMSAIRQQEIDEGWVSEPYWDAEGIQFVPRTWN